MAKLFLFKLKSSIYPWVEGNIQRRQWHPTPVLFPGESHGWRSLVGCSPWGLLRVRHDWVTSLSLFTFHFHALEKEMATHSSVFAWRIPGTEEPSGLPSMGSPRVGHDWSDLATAAVRPFLTHSYLLSPIGTSCREWERFQKTRNRQMSSFKNK